MIISSQELPFTEWVPDLGEYNAGLSTAKNCIAYKNLYKPVLQPESISDELGSKCLNAFSMRASDGTVHIFAGTATALYKLDGSTWVDVTRLSGSYNTSADGTWVFAVFGDVVCATNYADDIQQFDVLNDAEFSQLSATAPRARYIFVVNNFLVALDTVDGDGALAYRVKWSALGDITDWTPDINTQAGFNDLFGGGFGNIAGTGNQNYGTILQDTAIWRMEYVGGDSIFTFSLQVQQAGTKIAKSVKAVGNYTFFLDEDGFYLFDGTGVTPIGRGKIDKWFLNRFNSSYDYNLSSAIDPVNKLYVVAYPTVIDGGETPQEMLVFNYNESKWTYIEQQTDVVFGFLATGYTLETLSAAFPDIETVPYSLDSRFWQGGRFLLACVNSSHALCSFSGQPYTAIITTQESRLNENGKAVLTTIYPIIENGTIRARIAYRGLFGDSVSYTPYSAKNSITGSIDIMQEARFIRAEFELSGDWDNAKGFSYKARASGVV